MPRKKTTKIEAKQTVDTTPANVFEKLRLGESYTSLLLGIIVVVIVAIVAIAFARGKGATTPTLVTDTSSEKTVEEVSKTPETGKTYTVAEGDTLWSISEKAYKSGYNWVDIAQTNNLTSPNAIEVGIKLKLPEVKPKVVESASIDTQMQPSSASDSAAVSGAMPGEKGAIVELPANAISGDSYKIQQGDYLWDIAVRAYGDGYKWVEIARVNKIENPDVINSGTVLKLLR